MQDQISHLERPFILQNSLAVDSKEGGHLEDCCLSLGGGSLNGEEEIRRQTQHNLVIHWMWEERKRVTEVPG